MPPTSLFSDKITNLINSTLLWSLRQITINPQSIVTFNIAQPIIGKIQQIFSPRTFQSFQRPDKTVDALQNESIDLVIANLIDVKPLNFEELAREVKRILNNDGLFIFVLANEFYHTHQISLFQPKLSIHDDHVIANIPIDKLEYFSFHKEHIFSIDKNNTLLDCDIYFAATKKIISLIQNALTMFEVDKKEIFADKVTKPENNIETTEHESTDENEKAESSDSEESEASDKKENEIESTQEEREDKENDALAEKEDKKENIEESVETSEDEIEIEKTESSEELNTEKEEIPSEDITENGEPKENQIEKDSVREAHEETSEIDETESEDEDEDQEEDENEDDVEDEQEKDDPEEISKEKFEKFNDDVQEHQALLDQHAKDMHENLHEGTEILHEIKHNKLEENELNHKIEAINQAYNLHNQLSQKYNSLLNKQQLLINNFINSHTKILEKMNETHQYPLLLEKYKTSLASNKEVNTKLDKIANKLKLD